MAKVKYVDQTWGVGTSVEGETLSVNGFYTGEQIGTPMQAKNETEANKDAHYVEHGTVRYGTIMQDKDAKANMPSVDSNEASST